MIFTIFDLIKETKIFSQNLATRFRNHVGPTSIKVPSSHIKRKIEILSTRFRAIKFLVIFTIFDLILETKIFSQNLATRFRNHVGPTSIEVSSSHIKKKIEIPSTRSRAIKFFVDFHPFWLDFRDKNYNEKSSHTISEPRWPNINKGLLMPYQEENRNSIHAFSSNYVFRDFRI